MALDKEFAEKWAVALESGRYQQITGQLRDGNGFCCLGVAADLIDPSGWRENGRWHGDAIWILPLAVLRMIGMKHDEQTNLSRRNDGIECEPQTFPEIAAQIRHLAGIVSESAP